MVPAAAALAAIAVVLAIGFQSLGTRQNQRDIQADARRNEDLRAIAQLMYGPHPLPASLDDLPNKASLRLKDPVTGAAYEYHRKSDVEFELCATFVTSTPAAQYPWGNAFWMHPRGRHCYQLARNAPVY
jgi:hypothetical protein